MLRSRARQIPLSFHPNTSKVENTTLSLLLLTTCQSLYNSSVGLLFGRSWKLTRKHIISEKKLRHLIQLTTAKGLRHTSGPVQPSARYIYAIKKEIYQELTIYSSSTNVFCFTDRLEGRVLPAFGNGNIWYNKL